MDASDCQPDFCLDVYEPSGHGKRKRSISTNSTEYTKFKENIEYTVTVPGEYDMKVPMNEYFLNSSEQCKHFVLISFLLSFLLAISIILVSIFNAFFLIELLLTLFL